MATPPSYEKILDRILIDENPLQARIAELGRQVSADYADSQGLVLIGILKGCMMFFTDFMKQLSIPHVVDFMDVTSYGVGARESTGDVRILKDINVSIENRDVLIVEDIVDSGQTLARVLKIMEARDPSSLKVCTLLDKADRREVAINLDYIGFTIPNVFVFGYGLDIDEYYRNLPFIGIVKSGFAIAE